MKNSALGVNLADGHAGRQAEVAPLKRTLVAEELFVRAVPHAPPSMNMKRIHSAPVAMAPPVSINPYKNMKSPDFCGLCPMLTDIQIHTETTPQSQGFFLR